MEQSPEVQPEAHVQSDYRSQLALQDPKVKAKYECKAKKLIRRAWNLALSDAMQGKDLRAKR